MTRAGVVMAAAILAAAGCQVEAPLVERTGSGGAPRAGGVEVVTYSETVVAPDACYRISEDATRVVRGDVLAVQRKLFREPGICAQVLTPIEVTGAVTDTGAFSQVVLEIVDEGGRVTQSFPLSR